MLNVATESAASAPIPPLEPADVAVIDTRYADYKIIRRNGAVVGFAPNKIAIAVTKAFIAVQGGQAAAFSLGPDHAEPAWRAALEELIGESGMPPWVWDIASGPMPDLPS